MVKKYDLETSPELRYIDLTSEMGELGKELLKGSNYGKQDFNKTNNLESEMDYCFYFFYTLLNENDKRCYQNCKPIKVNKTLSVYSIKKKCLPNN